MIAAARLPLSALAIVVKREATGYSNSTVAGNSTSNSTSGSNSTSNSTTNSTASSSSGAPENVGALNLPYAAGVVAGVAALLL